MLMLHIHLFADWIDHAVGKYTYWGCIDTVAEVIFSHFLQHWQ